MGKKIIETITTHINNDATKYYSIVMDSAPDLSHIDQLAIVLQYCFREFLETNGLLLDNCRGLSFDNAANMSGQYNGVQALLKEINKFANYVPCAAHSLNLVRAELVKVATEIVNFFGLV
ncbi:zinc finger MYM-type protein 1 [Trichonephila clavipes]|nr:zinc finger MYM-type protein 1 [Trichonephila clavipes]